METTRLETGTLYKYKGKSYTYKYQSFLDRDRYIFIGSKGGEISLSQHQVEKYIREIH